MNYSLNFEPYLKAKERQEELQKAIQLNAGKSEEAQKKQAELESEAAGLLASGEDATAKIAELNQVRQIVDEALQQKKLLKAALDMATTEVKKKRAEAENLLRKTIKADHEKIMQDVIKHLAALQELYEEERILLQKAGRIFTNTSFLLPASNRFPVFDRELQLFTRTIKEKGYNL